MDTKTAILDTAERLFAERGIDGVSVRAILAEAGVNVALAHYHFGSRKGLIREVLRRRLVPLAEERRRLLEEVEAAASPGDPGIEEILRGFFTPAIRMLDETPHFARLAGHLHMTPDAELRKFYGSLFGETLRRYADALRKVLPAWQTATQHLCRGHFMIGAMVHTLVNYQDMVAMAHGRYEVPRGRSLVEELVAFCAAGLTAPPRRNAKGEQR